jgi:3-oxoacyl-[acyl-carrier-protein] synthase-3
MYIAGSGSHVPEARITNADLAEMVDTTPGWIVAHTGMQERRKASDDHDTSDLGVLATQRALERTGWEGGELDLLVVATSTPDRLIPATSSLIGKKMAINPVGFDVNAACSGFVYGLAVAQSLAVVHGYRRVALCVSEKYTRVTDYTDRTTCIFFGDSATTFLLQPERPASGLEIVDIVMENINEGADYAVTEVGGYFRQDGPRIKDYAVPAFVDSATEIMDRNDIDVSDLRAFAGHQANLRLLESVADKLGLRAEQHWYNVDYFGNQGAAGVATTLSQKIETVDEELEDGDLILVSVVGSGFTVGSTLLRWVA